MTVDDYRLLALAAAIADCVEVEWEYETTQAREDRERALIEAMRLVDRVAKARARERSR
jgi:hypothetical protein